MEILTMSFVEGRLNGIVKYFKKMKFIECVNVKYRFGLFTGKFVHKHVPILISDVLSRN
jgi:hypothetical protein